jgi:hypothetical protein
MFDKQHLREAYLAVCQGYSPDRVVADPILNMDFVRECNNRGLTLPASQLNRCLLNLRKAGALRGLKSQKTEFDDVDEYLFAAEIAARILERMKGCSLDDIICDPEITAEFDSIASQLSPGYDALKYRWAALNLRKTKNLRPELVAHVVPAEIVTFGRVRDLNLNEVPSRQGLYIFHTQAETLYVGEAVNLRNRIGKHLDHSDNKQLARWLWEFGIENVFLELQILSETTTLKTRRALESELIASRSPIFNVKG